MDIDAQKRAAAARALDFVQPGMRLGLGTGSTARPFVDLLGQRVRAGLAVIAVPTSEATRAQAERLGIPLTTLDETPELDLTVDGADEIAPDLSLIKGGGGALLREKIVAAASARMVVIADASKYVPVWDGSRCRRGGAVRFRRHAACGRSCVRGRRRDRAGAAAARPGRPRFRHRRRALDSRCRARTYSSPAGSGGSACFGGRQSNDSSQRRRKRSVWLAKNGSISGPLTVRV
jgi:hypothetical protein